METRKLAVIMFTDMVGYSKKVHADEEQALKLLTRHNKILEAQIAAYQGNVIKTIGDAFFADFDSVFSAVNCAIDIQKKLVEENAAHADEEQMQVRIGIHVGDVIYRDDDIFGDGVNIASRIEGEAGAGQIFISSDVFSITFGKLDCHYKDIGNRALKNIDRPVHLYEVLWDPARASEAMAETPVVPYEEAAEPKRNKGPVLAILAVLAIGLAGVIMGWPWSPWGTPADEQAVVDGGRLSLAVVSFADATGDERLKGVQIGKIIGSAVEQKFYEYPHVRLVSPLFVGRAKRELGYGDQDIAADPSLAEQIARKAQGNLVIAGSLARLGGQYILAAELTDLRGEQIGLLSSFRLSVDREDEIIGMMIDSLCAKFQRRLSDELGIREVGHIAPIGELATESLDAYGHFVRGYNLFRGGELMAGFAELAKATEADPDFAMAYSEAICALSFAKEDSLYNIYHAEAQRFKDELKGNSKEALLYRGNMAWGVDAETCRKSYQLITEMYPDDRDGYLYHGLYFHYIEGDYAKAIEEYDKAIKLTPDYFPAYRDKAYALQEVEDDDVAVALLREYLRNYGDGPGAEYARQTIAEIRGV